jgi:hypothetical protein
MMVGWGCAMWGTGWYYPPYIGLGGYYPVYYPWYPSYGYGAWYNPWNGAYTRAGAAYGPAGCGLGSMIFSPDSGLTQIFAATTNTSSGQTFGISSGTSNCDSNAAGTASAKVFVQTNRAALAKDIARGRGETITALSTLASCQNSAAVGARLQKKFRTIFSSAKVTDEQVSDSVVQVLKSDRTLGCGNLG